MIIKNVIRDDKSYNNNDSVVNNNVIFTEQFEI